MRNRIKEIRQAKNMSMYQLAEKSGLSRSQILKAERMDLETSNIRLNSMLMIAKGLDVTLFDLLDMNHEVVQQYVKKVEKKKVLLIKKIAKEMKLNIQVEEDE